MNNYQAHKYLLAICTVISRPILIFCFIFDQIFHTDSSAQISLLKFCKRFISLQAVCMSRPFHILWLFALKQTASINYKALRYAVHFSLAQTILPPKSHVTFSTETTSANTHRTSMTDAVHSIPGIDKSAPVATWAFSKFLIRPRHLIYRLNKIILIKYI